MLEIFFEVEMHRLKLESYHLNVIILDGTVQLHQNLSIPEINFRTSISVFQLEQKQLCRFLNTNLSRFWIKTTSNGRLLKNPDISSALPTLRIQYLYTQIQYEDSARDVRVL